MQYSSTARADNVKNDVSFANFEKRAALKAISAVGLLGLTAMPLWAQFRVEVSGVGLTQLPIALPVLTGEAQAPQKISAS